MPLISISCSPVILSNFSFLAGKDQQRLFKSSLFIFSMNKAHHVHKKSKAYFFLRTPFTKAIRQGLFYQWSFVVPRLVPSLHFLGVVNPDFLFFLKLRIVVKLRIGPCSSVVRA